MPRRVASIKPLSSRWQQQRQQQQRQQQQQTPTHLSSSSLFHSISTLFIIVLTTFVTYTTTTKHLQVDAFGGIIPLIIHPCPHHHHHNTRSRTVSSIMATTTTTRSSSSSNTENQSPNRRDDDPYTDDDIWNALNSLSSTKEPSIKSHGHLRGYNDHNNLQQGDLTTLQRITGTVILDYKTLISNIVEDGTTTTDGTTSTAPSEDELRSKITEFHTKHGPILNLYNVICQSKPSMALAAEFKRASPSKGIINPNANVGTQASLYFDGGASIISILTEKHWFQGTLDDLTQARLQTSTSTSTKSNNDQHKQRPVILRKDFITNEYQILEAAASGADSVLLIVAVLPLDTLKTLIQFCRSINMEPLVEVHADSELIVALEAGAKVIGVNNRNLHTFEMDMKRTEDIAMELRKKKKEDGHKLLSSSSSSSKDEDDSIVLCSLSGMSNADDVHRYRQVGVRMCLIGESLMRSSNPKDAIAALCLNPMDYEQSIGGRASGASSGGGGGAYIGGTKLIKVCGITNVEDALMACRAGANCIGLIFAERSKRRMEINDETMAVANAIRSFGERRTSMDWNTLLPKVSSSSSSSVVVSTLAARARIIEQIASKRPLVVGVFQNQSKEFIQRAIETCDLDLIQLHGNEGMAAANIDTYGIPAIRVVDIESNNTDDDDDDNDNKSLSSEERAENIMSTLTSDPTIILLDTSIRGSSSGGGGGTGTTFDWNVAEALQNKGLPVWIAGGLKPNNVNEAVSMIRPWGVDVSSGVEDVVPRKKDWKKVETFITNVRTAAVNANKGF